MFLEQIAAETPEATAALFEMRDAKAWQEKYRVSAEWLDAFLNSALDTGQDRFDWITDRAASGAEWVTVKKDADGQRVVTPGPLDTNQLLISAAATAWRQTVTTYKASHELWRAAEKAAEGRITYLDPTEDKRNAARACGWLVSWLFAGMSDGQIAKVANVSGWKVVGETRSAFAKTIGLKLASQRGRRGRKVPV
jgi:hypothetical protein